MALYRVLVSVFALWVLAGLAWRRDWTAIRQRLALERPTQAPHLWLHAASNGELASARPVISELQQARPGLTLLVTCNTATGVALARGWGLEARLAPLDLRGAAGRMHRRWNVCAHITMESELWPNRLFGCSGPVIVLGGRLTEGTARGWRVFSGLQRRVLQRISFLSAQDTASRDRFRAAGLPDAAAGPVVDLKALYAPATQRDADLAAAFERDQTWLAASTHEGEEEIVLAAHAEARRAEPQLRLILVPRHPRRADMVARLIAEVGFTVARRSLGEDAGNCDVYLADTMGEMGLLYPLAGRVFIGGTLTDRGGHTPYEPAVYGAALLHGPDIANFRAPFARLAEQNAASRITTAGELAAALNVLAAPASQRESGEAARKTLRPEADAKALVAAITQRLDGIA